MSGHNSDNSAVPNLTPLLDVVLQLLMFFMMCVNFVAGQASAAVILPAAETARPLPKPDAASVLFLNIDSGGSLIQPDGTVLTTMGQVRFYLNQEFTDANRVEKGKGAKILIVIRADEGTDYGKIYDIMTTCKQIGFQKIQLRARQKAK
jgi:biopolymer transport protein ExbD